MLPEQTRHLLTLELLTVLPIPEGKKKRRVSLAPRVIPGPSSGVRVNFRTLREVEKSSWFPLELFFQFLRVRKKDALALPQGLSQDQAQVVIILFLYLEKMAEQDPFVEVVKVPKFDMPFYESKLSKTDVKALAKKYDIPLDLHPCAPSEGWTVDKLPEEVIGLKGLVMFEVYCRSLGIAPTVSLFRVFYKISKQGHWFSFEKRVGKGAGGKIFRKTFSRMKGWKDKFLFLDWRAIPDAMAWRHHDSDINDVLPDGDYNVSNARTLVENIIDLHPMPLGLLFVAALASSFSFLSKEKKKIKAARAAAKKKENTKRVNDGEGGSKPKPKKRKTLAAKKPRFTGSDHVFRLSHPATRRDSSVGAPSLQVDEVSKWLNVEEGGLAQTDMLERFKNLQDDYTKLVETHKGCSDTVRKLVFARQDLEHNARLYTDMSNRYKTLKEEHLSCGPKVEMLTTEKDQLCAVNKDQAFRIQELEAGLSRKSADLEAAKGLCRGG
ncbi:hypothetical protein Tco_0975214 [Tanacetum coccineum]|uniref:Transposase n=1 Tax=Tanacetum coccineum TaxID=301880 RepID=A0ABQ5EE12_9ASTR